MCSNESLQSKFACTRQVATLIKVFLNYLEDVLEYFVRVLIHY